MPTTTVNPEDLQQVNAALAASEGDWQQQLAMAAAADARTSADESIDAQMAKSLGAAFGETETDDGVVSTDTSVATDDTATSTVQEQTQPVIPEASEVPAGAGSDIGDGAATPTPSDGSYVVTLGDGTEATITNEQLQSLVELGGWAQALPDDTRSQIAQVTEGRARAVDTTEYEQFRAWQQTQRPQTPDTSWKDDLDPDARAYIARLEQQASRVPELESRPTPVQSAEAVYALQRQEMEFRSSANQWFDERGLDAETGGQLFERMLHSGAISAFRPQFTRVHPVTGDEMGVDIKGLARAALDFALVQDPQLHSQTLATGAAPVTPAPATPPSVAQKIARASSLATAPSASVSQPPSDPSKWTPQETTSAIADFIRGQAAG